MRSLLFHLPIKQCLDVTKPTLIKYPDSSMALKNCQEIENKDQVLNIFTFIMFLFYNTPLDR